MTEHHNPELRAEDLAPSPATPAQLLELFLAASNLGQRVQKLEQLTSTQLDPSDMEQLVHDAVENGLECYDLSDQIQDALDDHDFTDDVQNAINGMTMSDLGLDDMVGEAINDAVRDLDLSDQIESAIRDMDFGSIVEDTLGDMDFDREIDRALERYDVQAQIDDRIAYSMDTDGFRCMVEGIVRATLKTLMESAKNNL